MERCTIEAFKLSLRQIKTMANEKYARNLLQTEDQTKTTEGYLVRLLKMYTNQCL